jgi:protein-glutamine gamma-glutamyltransferase
MASSAAVPESVRIPAERFFRGALYLLVLTSIGIIVSTGKLDLFSALLASTAILYKGYRLWRGEPAEISHRAATWAVILYLLVFPADALLLSPMLTQNSPNPVLYAALIAAVHFLLFITIARFYSATSHRDALFLTMLSFAGVLVSAVLTVDTTFLVLFFVYLLFACATFSSMEVRRGAFGAVIPAAALQPARERRLARALSLSTLSVALGGLVLGSVLFFFFPRFSAGYLGRTSLNPSLMSGFTKDVELGQIGELKMSSAVVMRVETGKPVAYERLRWRGVALPSFDGKRWFTADRNQEVLGVRGDGWIHMSEPAHTGGRVPTLEYTVFLEPMATDTVFVTGNALALRGNFAGEVASFGVPRRGFLNRDSTGSIANPFHNFAAIRYTGLSQLPPFDVAKLRLAATEYPPAIRERYLQLPVTDRRIAELAKEVTRNAESPVDKAVAIESFLRSRYSYSLNLTSNSGDDPLARFLFETKAGHCEYFASAMAVMLRTLGIPSREVNGFLPGEYNDLGGDYIVRASDAHSWVEAYFPGSDWVVFDPTPAGPAPTTGLLTRLAQYADWLELSWTEWVIGYDFAHQVVLTQALQRNSRSWRDTLHDWLERKQESGKGKLRAWQFRHAGTGFVIPVALVLLLAGLRLNWFARLFRKVRLFLLTQSGKAASPQLASLFYAELLRLLGRHGLRRGETQTPLEFALGLQPALAPAVLEFTRMYSEARFGNSACDASRFDALLSQVRSTLRAS